MTSSPADYQRWLSERASERPFGAGDRLGTANLIDASARLRARDAIVSGEFVRLSRPIRVPAPDGVGGRPAMVVTSEYLDGVFEVHESSLGVGLDRVEVACHGFDLTHMDAHNHMALDGAFYGQAPGDGGPAPDIADLARQCFFTRAVLADVPAVRGTDWVSHDVPVTGEDLEQAVGPDGVRPGDALLLYLGRDRYELAGHTVRHTERQDGSAGHRRPGVGHDAARWIVEHGVSVLCWDLQDAVHDAEPAFAVHQLIIAVGLVLVDNCHLGDAAAALRALGRRTAALSVQPLGLPQATGSVVEPVLVL